MRNIRCIVVDDEELARKLLENYISRMPDLQLVASCKDPLAAMQVLKEEEVDLIFLDIQMPELSGIDFIKSVQPDAQVVFTTAYSEYALEGYELNVIDYLLKPFGFDRFVKAVSKAAELIQLKEDSKAKAVGHQETSEFKKDYLLVKSEHKIHKIKYSDIHYIQGMREYVAYHLPDGRILSLASLKNLEKQLPSDQFIRIHKSYIVSKDKVKTLEGNLLHVSGEKLPIGAIYREAVLAGIF